MKRERKIYLAAPFFTPEELATVVRMEGTISGGRAVKGLFSPRKDGGNSNRQGDVRDNSADIYDANMSAMFTYTECIAWIDRDPGPNREVWLIDTLTEGPPELLKGPLTQPDLGTVFELGVYAGFRYLGVSPVTKYRYRTAAFTTRPRDQLATLNVMLLEGVNYLICGWEELSMYVNIPGGDNFHSRIVMDYPQFVLRNWEGDAE